MPFVRPAKNKNNQFNMGLKLDSEDLEFQMETDEIYSKDKKSYVGVEDSVCDFENLDCEEKSKNFAPKCKSNELKQKFAVDAGHIKKDNAIDFQTIEDDSNIYAKKLKLEYNSNSEQEFINFVPKVEDNTVQQVQEISKTEFKISLQDIASEIKIEIDSDTEDTPLHEIKKKIDNFKSVGQIKIEKDSEIPKIDNISVGEIKIEDGTYKASSASEDEYCDKEMQLSIDNYMDFNPEYYVNGKIESSEEYDMPSTSRAYLRKIKVKRKSKTAKVNLPVKVKEETNNESNSDPGDSQIPSDDDEEFLSTASGGEEFLSESDEKNSDSHKLSLENEDVVAQLIDEYHKRPQLWFEELSTELSALKKKQLYRSIKENLNKKFDKKYNVKCIKMFLKLLFKQYEQEIERQLLANEETTAESSLLWFYDKLYFLKDDIENTVKLKLEKSLKLLGNNNLANFIDIYKNYDSLWDTNNLSFPDQKQRHETMLSMCLEIKQKFNISFNTFKLKYQLSNLHSEVQKEKLERIRCEKNKMEYKPSFPFIKQCNFLENHEYPFKCHQCGRLCKSPNELRQHIAQHDGTSRFKCNICGIVCGSGKSLYGHSFHHNGINYSCRICGKSFIHPNTLRIHVKESHMHPEMFNCDVCGESFDHLEQTEDHKKLMHNQESVECKCEICGKVFQSATFLKLHNIKYKNKNFGCTMCEKRFHNRSVLKTHMNHAHLNC